MEIERFRFTRPGIIENAEEVLKDNDLQIMKRQLLLIFAGHLATNPDLNAEANAETICLYQDICDLMEAAHLLLSPPQ